MDIWIKSNTFPPTVLTRLRDTLTDVSKGAYHDPNTYPLSISSVHVILAIFTGVSALNEMRGSVAEIRFGCFLSESAACPVNVQPTVQAPETSTTPPLLAPQTGSSNPDVQLSLLSLLGQAAQANAQRSAVNLGPLSFVLISVPAKLRQTTRHSLNKHNSPCCSN